MITVLIVKMQNRLHHNGSKIVYCDVVISRGNEFVFPKLFFSKNPTMTLQTFRSND